MRIEVGIEAVEAYGGRSWIKINERGEYFSAVLAQYYDTNNFRQGLAGLSRIAGYNLVRK
jgi:hypothetical protein